METEEDDKAAVEIKYEPLNYDANDIVKTEEVLGSEEVNIVPDTSMIIKTELEIKEGKNDMDNEYDRLHHDFDSIDSIYVCELGHSLPGTSMNITEIEKEEKENEYSVDVKNESVEYDSSNIIKKEMDENNVINIENERFSCERERLAMRNAIKKSETQFECCDCGFKSKHKRALRSHIMSIHDKERAQTYTCEFCSYQTIHMENLKRHVRIHPEVLSLECVLCQKSFKWKVDLDAHYVSAHRNQSDSFKHLLTSKVNQCPKCDYAVVNTYSYKKHLLTHEEDRSKFMFECQTCGYKCIWKSSLITHVRMHTNQLPFDCTECTLRFNSKQLLDGHIVSQHKENEQLMKTITSKTHQCLTCTFKTVNSTNFKNHSKICAKVNQCSKCDHAAINMDNHKKHLLMHEERLHANELPFACTGCNRRFNQKLPLDGHIVFHHNENEQLMKTVTSKIHQCLKCTFKTVYPTNFKTHSKICAKVNQCSKCDYATVKPNYYKKHLLTHEEDQNRFKYQCSKCCFVTVHKYSVKRHLLTHVEDQKSFKYQCSKCSFVTIHKSNFKRHSLKHKEDRNKVMFECHTCGFKCTRKLNLITHVRLHANQLTLACTECNRRFNQKLTLDDQHEENEQLMKTNYKKHLLTHEERLHGNQSLFACTECNTVFNQKLPLDGHIMSKHTPVP